MLLAKFSQPCNVFEELKGHLSLASTEIRGDDNQEQIVETSLFMLGALRLATLCLAAGQGGTGAVGSSGRGAPYLLLFRTVHGTPSRLHVPSMLPAGTAGESAAACADVELQCCYLLCTHAAMRPHELPLVGATLDWVAARLGYPDRHAYVAWHQRVLLYHWCGIAPASLRPANGRVVLHMHDAKAAAPLGARLCRRRPLPCRFSVGYRLQHWLVVQCLVAPSAEAASGDARAFLAACAPALTAMLVYGDRGDDLQALAQALGKGGCGWAMAGWVCGAWPCPFPRRRPALNVPLPAATCLARRPRPLYTQSRRSLCGSTTSW